MDMYNRQKTLGLNINQSITCVGLGGIGYWVAKYLIMSGVEKVNLFDPETIEISNLNRLDIPITCIGMNKCDVAKQMIISLRPECSVISMPFKLQEHTFLKTDWIIDCTDNFSSQVENERISKVFNTKYVKAGYNGEHVSLSNTVASWGDAPDGYTVIPSWIVPASIIASLTVSKVLKYNTKEISTTIEKLFN